MTMLLENDYFWWLFITSKFSFKKGKITKELDQLKHLNTKIQ